MEPVSGSKGEGFKVFYCPLTNPKSSYILELTIKQKTNKKEQKEKKMNWYRTGDSAKKAIEAEQHRRDEAASQRGSSGKLFRFYLPVKTTTQITFLDGPTHPQGFPSPFIFKEHQVKLNGHWRNWFTCLAVPGPNGVRGRCPAEDAGDNSALVSAYTIIDHSRWEKDGKIHENEVKLFVCKMATHERLASQAIKRGGSLRGCRYEVTRGSGDKSVNVGDVFDYEGMTDLSLYGNPQPADYFKEFAPKSLNEMLSVFGGAPGNEGAGRENEEPVPQESKKVVW